MIAYTLSAAPAVATARGRARRFPLLTSLGRGGAAGRLRAKETLIIITGEYLDGVHLLSPANLPGWGVWGRRGRDRRGRGRGSRTSKGNRNVNNYH